MGTFSGVTLPWPGTFPSGCDSLVAGDCPLQIGESVKYEVVLPISPSWPTVSISNSMPDECIDLEYMSKRTSVY